MNALETFTVEDLTVKLYQDEDAETPREWDNFGVMVCFHPRYTLGDKDHGFTNGEALMEFLEEEKPPVVLPLLLLDHSGLWMRTTSFASDSQGWDTSRVGVIYATREKVIKEYGDDSPASIARARECLQAEVETYSQYLKGDVYGYVVEDKDGECLESCWGFYGAECVREEAKGLAESIAAQHRKERQAKVKAQIKNRVPLSRRGA